MRAAHFGSVLSGGRRRRGRLKLAHWNALERLMLLGILVLLLALVLGLPF
jgi:hypothetical protein